MRDIRYGARSSVSLDRGQLIGLGFFAILSGGLMFALGYAAGKNRRPVDVPQVSTLGRVDQNHDHQKQVDFTFYESLLEKQPRQKVEDLVPPASKPEEAPKPEPMKFAEQPSVKITTPEAPDAVKQALAKIATSNDQTKDDTETVEQAAALPAPVKKSAPVTTAVLPPETPAPSTGDYTIQLNAFRTDLEAQGFMKKLKAKGFAGEVAPGNVPGKGMWYRVRIGRFDSEAAAKAYKPKLDRAGFTPWVKKVD